MSDRYQHRLQIYHFTVGRLFLHLIYIKYYQEPSAIGAALTCPGLTRYDLWLLTFPPIFAAIVFVFMAPSNGFEPLNSESESDVLPIRLQGHMAAGDGVEPPYAGSKPAI